MVSLPGIPSLTQEQLQILNTCPRAHHDDNFSAVVDEKKKGQLTRITAAAGAGKTTTLLTLALRAFELGHQHITYVTFTNAAATDGKERLMSAVLQKQQLDNTVRGGIMIDARTLHSCAHRLLQKYIENNNHDEDRTHEHPALWTDKKIKNWISETCSNEIDSIPTTLFCHNCEKGIQE